MVELDVPDVGALLSSRGLTRAGTSGGRSTPAHSAELAQPVLAPSKVICLGLNYRSHVLETGREAPTYPTLFSKFARSLTGPRDPIVIPESAREVDWEAELALVIGREVRCASPGEARESIAGYTVLNDVSMRDWQTRTAQWLQGKMFERSTPVGPALVTPDEVDHAADLEVRCEIDGETVQLGRTSDLIFKPAEIVSYVSQILTLDPGDIISTGTPGGVGAARDPRRFLEPGQVLRTAIEGIGELVNEIRG
jgi:acylpyruvate hydrolase